MNKTPWYQSNLGASIVGGLIVLATTFLFTTAIKDLRFWQLAVIFGLLVLVVALVISLIKKSWREHVWVDLGRWLHGLGILTNNKRAALVQNGFDQRSADVLAERASPKEPSWKLDARDALGERNLYWLNNSGYAANDVRVTADPAYFITDGDVFWQSFGTGGPMGSVGSWFKGYATERGNAEGVDFEVSWVNLNGDAQARTVHLPPKEIRAGRDEALREEWAKGRVEGRAEALAEKRPALPLPEPRWAVTRSDDGSFELTNSVPRSVALEVRVEGDADFKVTDAGHWSDLSGESTGTFHGDANYQGRTQGVRFSVNWYNEAGTKKLEWVNVPRWEKAGPWDEEAPF